MNDHPQFKTIDELDFLMYFFNEGLFFENNFFEQFDNFHPIGYTDDLERYYDFLAGRVSSGEKPRFRIHDEYRELISKIESTQKDGFTRVTTCLLSLNSVSQEAIKDQLKRFLNLSKKDGKYHNFSLAGGDAKFGITFCINPSLKQNFWDIIFPYCERRMFEEQVEKWILLTVESEIGQLSIDFKLFEKDIEVRSVEGRPGRRSEKRKKGQIWRIGKKVKRNDPCPCKSGLKYKKCHGSIINMDYL